MILHWHTLSQPCRIPTVSSLRLYYLNESHFREKIVFICNIGSHSLSVQAVAVGFLFGQIRSIYTLSATDEPQFTDKYNTEILGWQNGVRLTV